MSYASLAHWLKAMELKTQRMLKLCKAANKVIFSLHKCLTHAYADIQTTIVVHRRIGKGEWKMSMFPQRWHVSLRFPNQVLKQQTNKQNLKEPIICPSHAHRECQDCTKWSEVRATRLGLNNQNKFYLCFVKRPMTMNILPFKQITQDWVH